MQIMIYDEFIQTKIRTFPIMDYVYNFQTINFIEFWLNRTVIAQHSEPMFASYMNGYFVWHTINKSDQKSFNFSNLGQLLFMLYS